MVRYKYNGCESVLGAGEVRLREPYRQHFFNITTKYANLFLEEEPPRGLFYVGESERINGK